WWVLGILLTVAGAISAAIIQSKKDKTPELDQITARPMVEAIAPVVVDEFRTYLLEQNKSLQEQVNALTKSNKEMYENLTETKAKLAELERRILYGGDKVERRDDTP